MAPRLAEKIDLAPFLFVLLAATCISVADAGEWSGDAQLDTRIFFADPLEPEQHGDIVSAAFEPDYYHDWDDGNQRFEFTLFGRWDSGDPERTHADIRELYWRKTFEFFPADLYVGLRKVFWGVAESNHLVDIINQTDLIEDIDGEAKLGQPMISLTWLKDIGTFDFFVMPYFRERTFPGPKGRPRFALVVDTDNPVFQSSREQEHVDFAVRWSQFLGDFDIGLSYFSGTSRQARFTLGFDSSGTPVLIPHYDQLQQTGLDLQATKGDWLWKLEAIHRDLSVENSFAWVGGFEYTLVGLAGSAVDLGLIAEYSRDNTKVLITGFQDDLALGARFAFNDTQSTELLAVTAYDLDTHGVFTSIEGNRRIGDSWKFYVEARLFANTSNDPLLSNFRNDDFLQLSIAKFF